LDIFCTLPTSEIEALVDLIIFISRSWLSDLSSQHVLMISLLSFRNSKSAGPHPQSLALLNNTQCVHLKSLPLDTEVLLLNFTEHFNFFNAEATLGCKLLDSFLKIRLKRINIQERIIVKTLNSGIIKLV